MLVPQTKLHRQAGQNNSLLPFDGQVFSHSQESRIPSCLIVTWKDSYHNSTDQPPSPSFPQLIMLSKMLSRREYKFGYTALLPVSPPHLLLTPRLLIMRLWQKQGRPLCCASTAQQELKHGCIIIVVVTNTERTTT